MGAPQVDPPVLWIISGPQLLQVWTTLTFPLPLHRWHMPLFDAMKPVPLHV